MDTMQQSFLLTLFVLHASLPSGSAREYCAWPAGPGPCNWLEWDEWRSCSEGCGGGYQTRRRTACCWPWHNYDECIEECDGMEPGDDTQTQSCNNFCYNGGTFRNNHCVCAQGYRGSCCQTYTTTSTSSTTTTTSSTTTTTSSMTTTTSSMTTKASTTTSTSGDEVTQMIRQITEMDPQHNAEEEKRPLSVYMLVSVPLMVITIIIAVICLCVWRKKNKQVPQDHDVQVHHLEDQRHNNAVQNEYETIRPVSPSMKKKAWELKKF